MAVIQTALDVPDDVFAGLLTGKYVRDGGVIRDVAGRLVKLLDDAAIDTDAQEAVRKGLNRAASRPKSVAIGIAAVAVAAATAGGAAFVASRRRRSAQPELPESVMTYNSALTTYLDAVRNGNLDASIIDGLIAAFDALTEESGGGDVNIYFSSEQSATLIDIVSDYTRNLVEANQLESQDSRPQRGEQRGTMIDLRRHLQVQRQIFAGAA